MCHPSTQHLPFTLHQENDESDSEDDDANIPDLEEVPTNRWVGDSETESETDPDLPGLESDSESEDDDAIPPVSVISAEDALRSYQMFYQRHLTYAAYAQTQLYMGYHTIYARYAHEEFD